MTIDNWLRSNFTSIAGIGKFLLTRFRTSHLDLVSPNYTKSNKLLYEDVSRIKAHYLNFLSTSNFFEKRWCLKLLLLQPSSPSLKKRTKKLFGEMKRKKRELFWRNFQFELRTSLHFSDWRVLDSCSHHLIRVYKK